MATEDNRKAQNDMVSTSLTKRRKIILLYASAGAGHRSASEAVHRSVLELEPEVDIQMIDILDYMPKIISQLYSEGYILVVSKYPMLWYFLYETGSDLTHFKPSGFWYRVCWQTLLRRLFVMLKREEPDLIISSHFLSSWAAGLYKRKYNIRCRVATIVTDYGVHPVWITPSHDYLFVATEQLKSELLPFSRFIGTDKIVSVGIPIKSIFGRPRDIGALRHKFNLDPDRRTILILGGMFGSRNIKDILFWLSDSKVPLQIIVVAGKHYPIMERVKEKLIKKDIKYQLYGYVDFMDELMALSDLAITKAGALTTTECLASGLPLVIFRPYPGQEVRNCDYFLEQGVGVRVDQIAGLCHKIDTILLEPGRLDQMKQRAVNTARSDAARNIAKILLDF